MGYSLSHVGKIVTRGVEVDTLRIEFVSRGIEVTYAWGRGCQTYGVEVVKHAGVEVVKRGLEVIKHGLFRRCWSEWSTNSSCFTFGLTICCLNSVGVSKLPLDRIVALLKVTSACVARCGSREANSTRDAGHECRVRLRRPYHPHSSIKCILRHWRKCTRLDRFVYRRKETVRTLQWSDITHIRGRMRGASRLGARTTVYFVLFTADAIRYRWWARFLHSRIRRWHADLRPLLRWRHEPPHIQACRLHR